MADEDPQMQMYLDDINATRKALRDPAEAFVLVSKLHRKACRTIAPVYGIAVVEARYRKVKDGSRLARGEFIPAPSDFRTLSQAYDWWTQEVTRRPKTARSRICKVCHPDLLLIDEQMRRS